VGEVLQSGLSAVDVHEFCGDRPRARNAISRHREGARSSAFAYAFAYAFALRFYFPPIVFTCLSPIMTTRRAITRPCARERGTLREPKDTGCRDAAHNGALGGRAKTLKDNEARLANATDLLQQTSLKGLRHSGPTAPFSIALAASFLSGAPTVRLILSPGCVPRGKAVMGRWGKEPYV
jgi:hypothetical protein